MANRGPRGRKRAHATLIPPFRTLLKAPSRHAHFTGCTTLEWKQRPVIPLASLRRRKGSVQAPCSSWQVETSPWDFVRGVSALLGGFLHAEHTRNCTGLREKKFPHTYEQKTHRQPAGCWLRSTSSGLPQPAVFSKSSRFLQYSGFPRKVRCRITWNQETRSTAAKAS